MEIDVKFKDDSKVRIIPNLWHHKMLMLQPKDTASVNVGSNGDEAAGPEKRTDISYEEIIQGHRDKEGVPLLCVGDIIEFYQPTMGLEKRWLRRAVVLQTDSSVFDTVIGYNIRTSYKSPIPNYTLAKIVGKVKDFNTGDFEEIKGHTFRQVQEYKLNDALISHNLEEACKEIQSNLNYNKEPGKVYDEYRKKAPALLEQHLSGEYDDEASLESVNSGERSGNKSDDEDADRIDVNL